MSRPSAVSGNSVFLATTALEDFWDASKPVLFLSEGCRRYSRRSIWETLNSRVLESPWNSEREVDQAYRFTADVNKEILPLLAQALNAAHGCRHDLRYWRILLGPWLNRYILVVYDRYRLIQQALNVAPDFTTIGLEEHCFITPRDTNDFELQILDDPYNLQFYTKIMTALGLNFPRKEMLVAPAPPAPSLQSSGDRASILSARLKRIAKNWYQAALKAGQKTRPIILKSSYFSRRAQILLSIKTAGRAWINETPSLPGIPTSEPLDEKLRSGLYTLPAKDEFNLILSQLLPKDMPRCFMEDYGKVKAYARAHYPAAPRAIFSANAWYCDEAFQHWAVVCAEEGTQLLGTQHGDYGVQHYMIHEAHELEITDRYYTWGWHRTGHRATTMAMPGSKLVGRATLRAENARSGLLFVMRTSPRFLMEFPYSPEQHPPYLLWQKLFVESLAPGLHCEIRARPHYADWGWDVEQRWREHFPHIAIEDWKKSFRESLADCRLFVADHISTPYLESLGAGKPTILFWKPDTSINKLRADAQEYFDGLRDVGILHDTPQSAAQAVENVYPDVETWWNEPRRKSAVERFQQRFARTSNTALSDWAAELIRIADAPSPKKFQQQSRI